MHLRVLRIVAPVLVPALFAVPLAAQTANLSAAEKAAAAGDTAATPLPLARDLSPKFRHREVVHAIRKVADWQLNRSQSLFNQDWTYAALYAGFMAVPDAADGARYRDAMRQMGEKFQWQLGPRPFHADDQAIGQIYLGLYAQLHDAKMIAPTRERMDRMLASPDPTDRPLWWWCDALFMAPPVLARLAKDTGERRYLDYMDRQWWITSGLLYNEKEHLYFRDAGFLTQKQANGRSIFWSRGNGWVMAGLVRVLDQMPADYPSRAKYVTQFQQMAAALVAVQGNDGLWRPGLLDQDSYPLPEVSGSAFITYALAYGVRTGLLDRREYLPHVQRGWAGLLSHVYEDGRLGCIQPIGAAPGQYTETASYVFGVGAYLLAGSEVYQLAR